MSTLVQQPPRIRHKVRHLLSSTMLCCGRRKITREVETQATDDGFRRPGSSRVRAVNHHPHAAHHPHHPEMVVQSDFRKVSGISTEIFRQIEAVEKGFSHADLEMVERRGEMVLRLVDPCSLGKAGAEAAKRYLRMADSFHLVRYVEIIKRPGQTLGLYIREGDGVTTGDGVFISRIALESAVYSSGLLKVGDEILAVNLVNVQHMSLDDVVIIMSIPRRLVLTIRSRIRGGKPVAVIERIEEQHAARPPVVVVKKVEEEDVDIHQNGENNGLMYGAGPVGKMYREEWPMYRPGIRPGPPPGMVLDEVRVDTQPWSRVAERPRPVIMAQPARFMSYPKTLESLAEHVHTFYSEFPKGNQMAPSTLGPENRRRLPFSTSYSVIHQPPPQERRQMYGGNWEFDRRGAGGPHRLQRAESEQGIASLGRRAGFGSTMSLSSARHAPQQRYEDVLRRKLSAADSSSLSDTETYSEERREAWRQRATLGRLAPRRLADLRSHSLPRPARTPSMGDIGGRRPPLRPFLPTTYDEDSDGAASAPELPASRAKRGKGGGGWPPSVFTAAEYRAWMKRAPSTSALYEHARGGGRSFRAVPQLPRSARSADSLLDTLRQEEMRELYKSPSFSRKSVLQTLVESPKMPAFQQSATLPRQHPQTLDLLKQVPHPSPVKPVDDGRRDMQTLNHRDFMKYRLEKEEAGLTFQSEGSFGPGDAAERRGDGEEAFSGLLWVHLLAGRGLRAAGHGGGSDQRRDLYCVIECDRAHKARTVIRSGEHSFDWDEIFELDLFSNREVAFLVYSWDPQFRHKLCFKGSLSLAATSLRECPVHSLALKMEPRGALYIKLKYRDPRITFQRLPAAANGVGVFGVDLETLVLREESGFAVPLVVKKCVEEVERRGLDIVGIYRLCGSAVRKKTLRDAFERNSVAADLSLEHVPDINVVTSVLKDYLRELPEPLFAEGLFDMLADALSVCLLDDPEGNAKLMFSILECLPKVHRCTVLYLMDHLQLVYSHRTRNKMTSEALAACFGPLFACHARAPTAHHPASVVDIHKPADVLKYLIDIWPAKKMPPNKLCLRSRSSDSLNQQQHQGDDDGLQRPNNHASNGVGPPPSSLKKSVTWMGQQMAAPSPRPNNHHSNHNSNNNHNNNNHHHHLPESSC